MVIAYIKLPPCLPGPQLPFMKLPATQHPKISAAYGSIAHNFAGSSQYYIFPYCLLTFVLIFVLTDLKKEMKSF